MNRASAIIVAGGSGRRLGTETPKQYLDLGGLPVIAWSALAVARARVDELVVGAAADWIERVEKILHDLPFPKPFKVIEGGDVRQVTVRRCLGAIRPESQVVAIHDAARPFVTPDLIDRTLQAARENSAATAAIPPSDTIKLTDPMGFSENLPRERLRIIQTPQSFKAQIIRQAHQEAKQAEYIGTDDTSLVERIGYAPVLVDGIPQNFKITSPFDLDLARALAGAAMVKPW